MSTRVEDVDTSECAKMRAVHAESQAIGEFIEWLGGQGVQLMRYEAVPDSRVCTNINCRDGQVRRGREKVDCAKCNGTGFEEYELTTWMPERRGIQQLLAEFFNIDLAKVDVEQRALLAAIRGDAHGT